MLQQLRESGQGTGQCTPHPTRSIGPQQFDGLRGGAPASFDNVCGYNFSPTRHSNAYDEGGTVLERFASCLPRVRRCPRVFLGEMVISTPGNGG